MLYWFFKWFSIGPLTRLLFRPWIEGEENLPESGPAILVSNHISAGDTFLVPAMIKRRLTFPAKAELFSGRGLRGRITGWFMKSIGQLPMDRSGGRASATSMDGVLGVLASGELLGIYPEGTRSPDGRLYKGKTGVARLVLQAGVPVIPVGMINTQFVPTRLFKIPLMRRPGVRIGKPLDFSRYAGSGNDRDRAALGHRRDHERRDGADGPDLCRRVRQLGERGRRRGPGDRRAGRQPARGRSTDPAES